MRIPTQLNQYTLTEHHILVANGMLHTQKRSQAQHLLGLTISLYVHNYLQTNTITVNTCPVTYPLPYANMFTFPSESTRSDITALVCVYGC